MKGPSPRRLWKYAAGPLGLKRFLPHPGDGRPQPQIRAGVLYWSMLIGQLLREFTFRGVEALAGSTARRALQVSQTFSDDTLAYFTERLDAGATRRAAAQVLARAKL